MVLVKNIPSDAPVNLSLWNIGMKPLLVKATKTGGSTMKLIFGRIFVGWAMLWFVLTMLVILPPTVYSLYLMRNPKRSVFFYHLSRFWMCIFLFGVGCPLRVRGKEHFKKGEKYIITINHNAFMDVPISCPFVPGTNKTIAKDDFKKVPLFGFIYRSGSVLINRKSEQSRRDGYNKMKEVLANGWHMCIYPEGTRNKTTQPLLPFKDGAFRLAVDTQTSIMPTLLFHTRKVQPHKPSFTFYPHRIEMHFLAPISVENKSAEELNQQVWQVMHDYYAANA